MADPMRDTVDRVIEFWNTGNADIAKQVIGDNYVGRHTALPEPLKGRDALVSYAKEVRAAFPDFRLEVLDMLSQASKVAVRWKWTGTHKGEWQGIAPTGKQVSQWGVTIARIENGRSVEEHISADGIGLLQQLGVLPAEAQRRVGGAG
jgi:steroid delta-isomerase-like uncharacterized protein